MHAMFLQLVSAENGIPGKSLVSPSFAAIAAPLDDGDATREARKFIEEREKVQAGHRSVGLRVPCIHHTLDGLVPSDGPFGVKEEHVGCHPSAIRGIKIAHSGENP